ncbi:flagellar biosynthesis protein FliQ [Opitutales bacterium ASA1]|jgi:flagellar biosynthetic protein FliQ|uniref:flagellar biosynthetic protein FliQ n=1 Tax=Congregicoccus parvus TaxID=3081749 RepID=UPI002B31785A|nr:flagellar biosynthesis protein FliQ [Opitutales bacterium ASA1]
MNLEAAIDLFRLTITQSLLLVAPILATAMSVGLAISLVQAVTSIQEQTLAFVPKLLAVGGVLIVSASWFMRTLMEFTISMVQRFPEITR